MPRAIAIGLLFLFWTAECRAQSRVHIHARFDHMPDKWARQWMEKEAASLFLDAGVELTWPTTPRAELRDVSYRVIHMRFRGTCACEPRLTPPIDPGPLAWTKVKGRRILPVVEVDCERVASIVRLNRGSLSAPLVARAFGRALGRIVAHELYHYFTQSFEHNHSDLFRRDMLVATMMREDVRFDGLEMAAIRQYATRPPEPGSGGDDVLSVFVFAEGTRGAGEAAVH